MTEASTSRRNGAPRVPRTLSITRGLICGVLATACGGSPAEIPAGRPGAAPSWRAPDVLPCRAVPGDLGAKALAHAQGIVALGPRTPGSEANRQSIAYCGQRLTELGFQVEVDTWTETAEGDVTLRNLRAVLPGQVPDRILLACHHDTKITSGHDDPSHNFRFDGANDGASGQGVLLALAELLAAEPLPQATVEIVMFDGEESFPFVWEPSRALYGSRRYVRNYREATLGAGQPARIRAMVLLDMVGGRDMNIDDETNSTPGLRRLLKVAVASCGYRDRFFAHQGGSVDDHVPFLKAGIPALDLIDLYGNRKWHTPADTVENLSADSMQTVAQVVWTMLPAIEAGYLPDPERNLRLPR